MTITIEQLQADIDALKKHNEAIIGEKRALSARLKDFDGIDAAQIRALLASSADDAELADLKAGKVKLDEIVRRRSDKTERELRAQVEAEKKRAEEIDGRYRKSRVDSAISQAALDAGVSKTALVDVVARAKGVFKLTDADEIEGRGGVTIGKYLEELRQSAPHLWPAATGAGLKGGAAIAGDKLLEAAKTGDWKTYRELRKNK